MVERFYCQLKAALMTRASNTWLLDLPIVLLGTRASLKVDLKYTMAELVYGTIVRLPGDFVSLLPHFSCESIGPTVLCGMTEVYDVTLECYTILLPL